MRGRYRGKRKGCRKPNLSLAFMVEIKNKLWIMVGDRVYWMHPTKGWRSCKPEGID